MILLTMGKSASTLIIRPVKTLKLSSPMPRSGAFESSLEQTQPLSPPGGTLPGGLNGCVCSNELSSTPLGWLDFSPPAHLYFISSAHFCASIRLYHRGRETHSQDCTEATRRASVRF